MVYSAVARQSSFEHERRLQFVNPITRTVEHAASLEFESEEETELGWTLG